MRIVIAPQALKGSLTAPEAARAIAGGFQKVLPTAELDLVPIADGGEGTVEALVSATGGQLLHAQVTGPLGEPVEATFGLLGDGQTAVIEMAACAGLPLVPPERRDPRLTTTYGVGELIRAALDSGCRHLIIGIGGSATNDGGAGMAQALGVRLLDAEGKDLPYGGAALAGLARIVPDGIDPRLQECRIEVACDVTNPLCGPQGASAVYGPQKGASPEMVAQLDAALAHYAGIIQRDLGRDVRNLPGAGAAGGLGASLLAFLQATLRPGADLVLEAVGLAKRLQGASLLVTAEGQIDRQTAYGKSVGAVASLAQRCGVPVLALAGSLGEEYQVVYALGVEAVMTLLAAPLSLNEAMTQAASLLADASERAARLLLLGRRLPPLEGFTF
ncbi:glycerate kinase [Thermogemmatispora onikobensis]|uniref:glycerate kinase n=1 Tax=Thermogemmatispora onikobensis TaxID=732234 RepID=UPI000853AA97|nr:glycerate kinase [Thermogemmatispora onikobensis]